MNDNALAAHVEDEQRAKMKEASTALVTEAKREILWLKGFGIFYVFGTFAIIQIATDKFPIALISSVAMFTFIKRYIDTKPDCFVYHIFAYAFLIPKHLSLNSENTKNFDFTKKLRTEVASGKI